VTIVVLTTSRYDHWLGYPCYDVDTMSSVIGFCLPATTVHGRRAGNVNILLCLHQLIEGYLDVIGVG
jgi:hypothetical protein